MQDATDRFMREFHARTVRTTKLIHMLTKWVIPFFAASIIGWNYGPLPGVLLGLLARLLAHPIAAPIMLIFSAIEILRSRSAGLTPQQTIEWMQLNPPPAATRIRHKGDHPVMNRSKHPEGDEDQELRSIVSQFVSNKLSTAPSDLGPGEAFAWHHIDELTRDSSRPGAPSNIVDDFRSVLDWLGVDRYENVTDAHRRRWIDAHRLFIREGVPPSLELEDAFASLKLMTLPPTDDDLRITAELRAVISRLYAKDDQIANAKSMRSTQFR